MADRAKLVLGVAGLIAAVIFSSDTFAFTVMSTPTTAGVPASPVVAFGVNGRKTAEIFAAERGIDPQTVKKSYSASGLITCGDAHGAGQLTEAADVVTTAAHVLFDEEGNPRAATCTFSVLSDAKLIRVPVNMASVVAGSRKPYSVQAVHDWAVVKLEKAVDGVAPYQLADAMAVNKDVLFAARGHFDWGNGRVMSMEACRLQAQLNKGAEGTREFAFDCETGDGASGGAVLTGDDKLHIGAILVGWRSNSPTKLVPFSPMHYNFVVSIEGAFRDAVSNAAKRVVGAN